MANIYTSKPGTLIKDKVSSPTFVTIDGLRLGDKMIATSFKLDRGQDIHHQKTIDQDIYSYAFGESVGRIQLGGMMFFGDCSGSSFKALDTINKYYSDNNAFTKGSTVTCTIGSHNAFKCYLENLSVNVEASAYNTGSFSLGFSVIPASAKGTGKKKKGFGVKGLGPLGTNNSAQASSKPVGGTLL